VTVTPNGIKPTDGIKLKELQNQSVDLLLLLEYHNYLDCLMIKHFLQML
jgi:hypothetical protein